MHPYDVCIPQSNDDFASLSNQNKLFTRSLKVQTVKSFRLKYTVTGAALAGNFDVPKFALEKSNCMLGSYTSLQEVKTKRRYCCMNAE
jgi:hypothetical protein